MNSINAMLDVFSKVSPENINSIEAYASSMCRLCVQHLVESHYNAMRDWFKANMLEQHHSLLEADLYGADRKIIGRMLPSWCTAVLINSKDHHATLVDLAQLCQIKAGFGVT